MSNHTPPCWHHWQQAWYVVARSEQIKIGQRHSGHLGGRQWVLYRGESGRLYAMDAFCPHMGAHLQSARVVGETLECGLHACRIVPQTTTPTATDRLPVASPQSIAASAWCCAERFGLVWLYPPDDNPPALPFGDIEDQYHWRSAGPQSIAADWRAMIANGFDLAHLQAVHQREVVGEPQFEHLSEGSLQMSYQTRVLQRGGLSSWLMKKLSGGTIDLIHTCCGSTIMVQSRLGRFQSVGVFALLPQDTPDSPADNTPEQRQTLAFAAVGLPQATRFISLKLWLTRWLYLSFLKKDFRVVKRMRMQLDNIDDVGVQTLAAYQQTLPEMNSKQTGISEANDD